MKKRDVRWQQRFDNYLSAFLQLDNAVKLAQQRPLTDLEQQGIIQAFEFTHELAWNLLKDYLVYQGITGLTGSRDTCREAFQKGLILEGEIWMEMISSRNLTSHTYNKKIAEGIVTSICERYYDCFCKLRMTMQRLRDHDS